VALEATGTVVAVGVEEGTVEAWGWAGVVDVGVVEALVGTIVAGATGASGAWNNVFQKFWPGGTSGGWGHAE